MNDKELEIRIRAGERAKQALQRIRTLVARG